jgi:hypothetical protein
MDIIAGRSYPSWPGRDWRDVGSENGSSVITARLKCPFRQCLRVGQLPIFKIGELQRCRSDGAGYQLRAVADGGCRMSRRPKRPMSKQQARATLSKEGSYEASHIFTFDFYFCPSLCRRSISNHPSWDVRGCQTPKLFCVAGGHANWSFSLVQCQHDLEH